MHGPVPFLSHLLPALRETRAPLVSGYVWLLAIWLSIEGSIPVRTEVEPGTVEYAIGRAYDAVGSVGATIALSLVAFLIGTAADEVLGKIAAVLRLQPSRDDSEELKQIAARS